MNPDSPRKRPREAELCSRPRTRVRLSASPPAHSAPATTASKKSIPPADVDSDDSSELSESSEEPSSESSSEESEDGNEESDEESDARSQDETTIENLRANRGKKPVMKLSQYDLGPDIRTFLKDFLPQLKAANDELEAERRAGTLKQRAIDAGSEEEEGQYIEMDLGLGVLEERNADAVGSSSSSDEEDGEPHEKSVMSKLLGKTSDTKSVGIEEVSSAQNT